MRWVHVVRDDVMWRSNSGQHEIREKRGAGQLLQPRGSGGFKTDLLNFLFCFSVVVVRFNVWRRWNTYSNPRCWLWCWWCWCGTIKSEWSCRGRDYPWTRGRPWVLGSGKSRGITCFILGPGPYQLALVGYNLLSVLLFLPKIYLWYIIIKFKVYKIIS